MNLLKKDRWSPYLVGLLIGLLSWVTFGVMGKSLGVSSSFVHLVALIEHWIFPKHMQNLTYFQKVLKNKAFIDWQFLFVVGIFLGSFIASKLSNSFYRDLPKIWKACYGSSPTKRRLFAFIGGFLLIIGARLAGGCTSGHGISGGMQFAVSSWIFVIFAFAAGIPFSFYFYKAKEEK